MIKKTLIFILTGIFLNLLFVTYVFSDAVYLKDGRREEGEIIEETDDYIVILDPKSLWQIVVYKKLIDKVERDKKYIEPREYPPFIIGSEEFKKDELIPKSTKTSAVRDVGVVAEKSSHINIKKLLSGSGLIFVLIFLSLLFWYQKKLR